jgi:hypothetical protein
VAVLVADKVMAAAEGVLDTTTFVAGKGGRGHRADRDIHRNMGVDDIPDSHRRYYQTIQIHARRLPVKKGSAVPIQRFPGSTVGVAAAVVVVDNHPEHTAAEALRSDLVEAVRDDSPVAVVARSMVGSIRSWV